MNKSNLSVPSLSFSVGIGILIYHYVPVPEGLEAATGIAAFAAVVAPFAELGKRALTRIGNMILEDKDEQA